jgi:hypothetical protein
VLPGLPILDPIPKGILQALGSVALATVGIGFALSTIPAASPSLLENLALVGAALLIAYTVEAVWLAQRAEIDEEYEEWLGFLVGTGLAGLLAIAFALLLSDHRVAGHDNLVDDFGLAWVVVSLIILGGVLVVQPLLAMRFRSDRG